MLLTTSVPSASDVMLSGKRPVFGSLTAVGLSTAGTGKAAPDIVSDRAEGLSAVRTVSMPLVT